MDENLIPGHKFYFNKKQFTIEKIHRIIGCTIEESYWVLVLLNTNQSFDRIKHLELLYTEFS